MTKIIRVEKCEDCPYEYCGTIDFNDDGTIDDKASSPPYCGKKNKSISSVYEIPSWCPLETEGEKGE